MIEAFDNTENLKKWQPGLKSIEHISGESGRDGAKMRLTFDMGKRQFEMIETITKRNLPDEYSGTYEAKGMWNEVRNFFEEKGNITTYRTINTFEARGFMKLVLWLMPGAFKKQSLKYMTLFKEFAEREFAEREYA